MHAIYTSRWHVRNYARVLWKGGITRTKPVFPSQHDTGPGLPGSTLVMRSQRPSPSRLSVDGNDKWWTKDIRYISEGWVYFYLKHVERYINFQILTSPCNLLNDVEIHVHILNQSNQSCPRSNFEHIQVMQFSTTFLSQQVMPWELIPEHKLSMLGWSLAIPRAMFQ